MKSIWDVAFKRAWANFELSYECWDRSAFSTRRGGIEQSICWLGQSIVAQWAFTAGRGAKRQEREFWSFAICNSMIPELDGMVM